MREDLLPRPVVPQPHLDTRLPRVGDLAQRGLHLLEIELKQLRHLLLIRARG